MERLSNLSNGTLLVSGSLGQLGLFPNTEIGSLVYGEGTWIRFKSWSHRLELCEPRRWFSLSEPPFSHLEKAAYIQHHIVASEDEKR